MIQKISSQEKEGPPAAESPSPIAVVVAGQLPLLHAEVVVADLQTELLLAVIVETAGAGRIHEINSLLLAVFSYIEVDLTRMSNLAAGLHPS